MRFRYYYKFLNNIIRNLNNQLIQQLAKKYEQVLEMLDKYSEKLGMGLFKKNLLIRSQTQPQVSEENLKQCSTFKRDTHYESISSLQNAQQIQQIQLDLTKQSERVAKSTFHSRQASGIRQPSQFNPNPYLVKRCGWMQIIIKLKISKNENHYIKSLLLERFKRHSKQEEFSPIRKQEIIQEVLDSKLISKESTKFISQALTTPKPKISIMNLVVLFNLRYFHLESPGDKNYQNQLQNTFFKILTYVDDPPYQFVSDRQLQIKELIKKTKRRSKITRQNSFAIKPRLGLKSQFILRKQILVKKLDRISIKLNL